MVWSDGTIRQLLTSGNLRLMSEQGMSDSIMNYYGVNKDLATGQAEILLNQSSVHILLLKIFLTGLL